MNSSPNKTPIKVIREGGLEVLFLETFILVLMRCDTKIHGKNLFIQKILILNIGFQLEQWLSGYSTGFTIQGSSVQDYWVAPTLAQLFILLRSLKLIPGTNLVTW